MTKTLISIVCPVYNEQDNIARVVAAITELFHQKLSQYDYEILFVDDSSTDSTRSVIEQLAQTNSHIKAIFNFGNYRPDISSYYGLINSTGDAAIRIDADFQYPLEVIPQFIAVWEKSRSAGQTLGVVMGVKDNYARSGIYKLFANLFYALLHNFSDKTATQGFNGFGLYDRTTLDLLAETNDSLPTMRTAIFRYKIPFEVVKFTQKTSINQTSRVSFTNAYDDAMLFLTSSTKTVIRIMLLFGIIISLIALISGVLVIAYKIINPESYSAGIPTIIILLMLLGGGILLFLAIIAEYIYTISRRLLVQNRPAIIERARIGFTESLTPSPPERSSIIK